MTDALPIHMPCGCPYPKLGDHRSCDHGNPGDVDDCPWSHMDDGSHSALYEDGERCSWCGELGPD